MPYRDEEAHRRIDAIEESQKGHRTTQGALAVSVGKVEARVDWLSASQKWQFGLLAALIVMVAGVLVQRIVAPPAPPAPTHALCQ